MLEKKMVILINKHVHTCIAVSKRKSYPDTRKPLRQSPCHETTDKDASLTQEIRQVRVIDREIKNAGLVGDPSLT